VADPTPPFILLGVEECHIPASLLPDIPAAWQHVAGCYVCLRNMARQYLNRTGEVGLPIFDAQITPAALNSSPTDPN
jgi:hypothetical protein